MLLGLYKLFYRYHVNILQWTACSYLFFNLTRLSHCLLECSIKIVLIFNQLQCCLYSRTAIYVLLPIFANKETQCLSCSASYRTAHLLYKLYSLQLNCTYSNYKEAAATCSAAQQDSTFTVQILYKLYSLQLNCTYSNYTEAAATCSAAQQHSTFTVQILYKLYHLQPNCCYSNYTQAAATCSAAQQHSTITVRILYKLYIVQLYCTYSK